MARFNCNDCVKFGTDSCRYGANHRDYSEYCDDILVEQNHAYNKAIDDCLVEISGLLAFYEQSCEEQLYTNWVERDVKQLFDCIEQLKGEL